MKQATSSCAASSRRCRGSGWGSGRVPPAAWISLAASWLALTSRWCTSGDLIKTTSCIAGTEPQHCQVVSRYSLETAAGGQQQIAHVGKSWGVAGL